MNFKMSKWGGPISRAIYDKLKENLNPIHLDIINESYMHNVPKNSETHFKIVVVSDKFNDMPLIKVSGNFHILYAYVYIFDSYET